MIVMGHDQEKQPTSERSQRMQPMLVAKRFEDIPALAQYPLFKALSPAEFGRVLDRLDELVVPPQAVVVDEGLADDGMYFVLDGTLRVTHAGRDMGQLGRGESFGDAALARPGTWPIRVSAVSETRLVRFSRRAYESFFTHPALGLKLATALSARLAEQVIQDGKPAVAPVSTFLKPSGAGRLVGALSENRPVSLNAPLLWNARLQPLYLSHPEGREVFLRSVGLLVLAAMAQVAPDTPCRWGPGLGPAQVLHVGNVRIAELSQKMQRALETMVSARTAFCEEVWTVEEARHHFLERGWTDAAAMLRFHKDASVRVVRCGNVVAPAMGPVLPDAGHIGPVHVVSHPEGLLIDLNEHLAEAASGHEHDTRIDPVMQEMRAPRYGGEMAAAAQSWLTALDVTSVGLFNEACVSGKVGELVRVSEGFHEKQVGRIADAILAHQDNLRAIRIAGPSCSGKTTFIKRLNVQLEIDGLRPVCISLDDYYLDRQLTPRRKDGQLDFESPAAIDDALLREQVGDLVAGKTVKVARFDFLTGKSIPHGGNEIRLTAHDVLVLEGLHGLNPSFLAGVLPREQCFGIFVHPATTLPFDRLNGVAIEDVRLLRRIVRDRRQRGYSAAESILRWPDVRHGEQTHVFPSEPFADAVFDSSLVYELSLLKVFAERYLLEVEQDHEAFPTAFRLRALIDRFVAIDPSHAPPTSVLREFIGGSGFEY